MFFLPSNQGPISAGTTAEGRTEDAGMDKPNILRRRGLKVGLGNNLIQTIRVLSEPDQCQTRTRSDQIRARARLDLDQSCVRYLYSSPSLYLIRNITFKCKLKYECYYFSSEKYFSCLLSSPNDRPCQSLVFSDSTLYLRHNH